MIPTPMQYLVTYAIVFVAGAVSTVATHLYGKRMRAAGERDARAKAK